MKAYMSINTREFVESRTKGIAARIVPLDGGEIGRGNPERVDIHCLQDFKDGLIVYSDGSQKTIDMGCN